MKLASLKTGGPDGTLIVVNRALRRAVAVPGIARTLQAALDDWTTLCPELRSIYRLLNAGELRDAFELDPMMLAAPLPRAYQWADGSAYVTHVELVRKARGAAMPESLWTDPLMYQGGSDGFLGPRDPVTLADEAWGIDFEAEVAVIVDAVPMGVTPAQAAAHIRLVLLVNDVSLRNLIPGELAKGFGFFQSKPASAFSPVVVSPKELGAAWDGGKLCLKLRCHLNDVLFGEPNAGVDMTFDFPRLIAHAARTRALGAGSIIGSGTVSNRDPDAGSCCIQERRMIETIEHGGPRTPFLKFGDRVRIEMLDDAGASIFGAIEQEVTRYAGPSTAEPQR
jgi:fumarylacetoacetate (FAA) hydrolase